MPLTSYEIGALYNLMKAIHTDNSAVSHIILQSLEDNATTDTESLHEHPKLEELVELGKVHMNKLNIPTPPATHDNPNDADFKPAVMPDEQELKQLMSEEDWDEAMKARGKFRKVFPDTHTMSNENLTYAKAKLHELYSAATEGQEQKFYWFTSERSSYPTIAQFVGEWWYLIGEDNPVTIEELNRRGWQLEEEVVRFTPEQKEWSRQTGEHESSTPSEALSKPPVDFDTDKPELYIIEYGYRHRVNGPTIVRHSQGLWPDYLQGLIGVAAEEEALHHPYADSVCTLCGEKPALNEDGSGMGWSTRCEKNITKEHRWRRPITIRQRPTDEEVAEVLGTPLPDRAKVTKAFAMIEARKASLWNMVEDKQTYSLRSEIAFIEEVLKILEGKE